MILFSTNPLLFKIRYVNRERYETADSVSSVIGRAFHLAMQVFYGSPEAEAIELGLKSGMEFLEAHNDGFINFSKTVENKQAAYDRFAFAYSEYIKIKPHQNGTQLLGCELPINQCIDFEWRGKRLTLPVPLKGILDKVVRDAEGRIKIVDYKTCSTFSDPDKIDGAKIIQTVTYYLLTYALFGEEPYSLVFEEVKTTPNRDKSPQVREYEVVFAKNELYFDFFFRFYEDMVKSLNGESVYVPNVKAMFDNEFGIVAYINRLDIAEEVAKRMRDNKVTTLTELLKRDIQRAANMRELLKSADTLFVEAKNINYEAMQNHEKIQTKVLEHGMVLKFDSVIEGATVDMYRFTTSIGLKMSRLKNYVEDIEQVLGVTGVRILAPIPNSSLIGVEVPRAERRFPTVPNSDGLNLAIGETITGEVRRFDLREAPHMLVAGSSGAGKSVFLNSVIEQLLTVDNVELHLFDPKLVELAIYEGRVAEYQSDHEAINESLQYLCLVMNERYELMKKAGVRDIRNMPGMPYKVVVIDEFGDLILSADVEHAVLMLAQKARAAGIHLIVSTQRPSVDVISGSIKANFPVKVVFRTAKQVDSKVTLDEPGAEKLLGKGDMLFQGTGPIERLQGYYTA